MTPSVEGSGWECSTKQRFFPKVGRLWNVCLGPEETRLLACASEDRCVPLFRYSLAFRKWYRIGEIDCREEHSKTIRHVDIVLTDNQEIRVSCSSFDSLVTVWTAKLDDLNCLPETNGSGSYDPREPFDLRTVLSGRECEVKCAKFSADGHLIATCSRDKAVFLYSLTLEDESDAAHCIAVLAEHTHDVKYIAWRPGYDRTAAGGGDMELYSTSYDTTIKVWKPVLDEQHADEDWELVSTLEGHTDTVWQMAFSPSGDRFASCSSDKTIRVWVEDDEAEIRGNRNLAVDLLHMRGVFASVGQTLAKKKLSETMQRGPRWRTAYVIEDWHRLAIYTVAWVRLENNTEMILSGGADNKIMFFREKNWDHDPKKNWWY